MWRCSLSGDAFCINGCGRVMMSLVHKAASFYRLKYKQRPYGTFSCPLSSPSAALVFLLLTRVLCTLFVDSSHNHEALKSPV